MLSPLLTLVTETWLAVASVTTAPEAPLHSVVPQMVKGGAPLDAVCGEQPATENGAAIKTSMNQTTGMPVMVPHVAGDPYPRFAA